jgi:type IV pilus assembly protein PilB
MSSPTIGRLPEAILPAEEEGKPSRRALSSSLKVSRPPLRLGERLLKANLISADDLDSALSRQDGKSSRLGEMLVEMGLLSEEQLLPFVAEHLNLPTTRLRDGMVDPEVVKLLTREKCESLGCLPLFKVRGIVTVAMSEPHDLRLVDEVERVLRLRVHPVFAFRSNIERMIKRCFEEGFAVDSVTADMDESSLEVKADASEFDLKSVTVEDLVNGSPVINLVNYLVLSAARLGASDIHIEPDRRFTVVRLRIDGLLREVLRPRRDMHAAIVSRIKVMAKMDIAEHRRPQDGRINVVADGREIDLRINTLPTVNGEKVVMRVLDRRRVSFDLTTLGMPQNVLGMFRQMLSRPHGLILVTGPTGSGKTTTLYSALELIKGVHRNIVTIEDPVEYQLELINQVQVNEAADVRFAEALRAILRQDPDVIMVGEIRDSETAHVACQASLTGHLVLSTLHTNDSAASITRLIDMGVPPYLLASAFSGAVAQRLVRTICPACRTNTFPSAEVLRTVKYVGDVRRPFVRGEGCPQCSDTGYKGQIGIYEILVSSMELRELITRGATLNEVRAWSQHHGGTSLLTEGVATAERGMTSLEEVIRVAVFE